jgi:hypothetical protein
MSVWGWLACTNGAFAPTVITQLQGRAESKSKKNEKAMTP